MRALAPLLAALALNACGAVPRCSWHRCAPEGAAYIYDPRAPGLPYSDVVAETLADWRAAGLPEPTFDRVSVLWADGPVRGGRSHAYVATSTRHRIGLVVRRDLGEAVTRDLIRHELVHAFGSRAGMATGLDRYHEDRARCPVDPGFCDD